jgi:hypothetical protein
MTNSQCVSAGPGFPSAAGLGTKRPAAAARRSMTWDLADLFASLSREQQGGQRAWRQFSDSGAGLRSGGADHAGTGRARHGVRCKSFGTGA